MANRNDVRKELEKTFDKLAKKGILKGADKKELIDMVMDSIEKAGTMSKLDLSNPKLIQTLGIALTAASAMKNDPKLDLKVDLLFKDNLSKDEKKDVKDLLTTVNKMLPKELQLSDKELDKLLDEITQKKNTDKDNENKSTNDADMDNSMNLDSATSFLQMLLNTPNPYQTTGQQIVVQQEVGNATAIVDQNMTFKNDALSDDSRILEGRTDENARPEGQTEHSKSENEEQPGSPLPQEHEESPKEAQEEEHYKSPTPFDGMKNNTPFSHH